MESKLRPILLVNPLPNTLKHYEAELKATLQAAGATDIRIAETTPGDAITGARHRLSVAATTVRERYRIFKGTRGHTIVVLWPLFGYLDPITFLRAATTNRLKIIVHDPYPLRRSYGQSLLFKRIFRLTVQKFGIGIIYHTSTAQTAGIGCCGVAGNVVPHPILGKFHRTEKVGDNLRPVIRVLGQYKPTRAISALSQIAVASGGRLKLEIFGRGWPEIAGWEVNDQFLSENSFSETLQSSDCVVVPYDAFFQSGVAVRCLEAGVPVVAPNHEHIAQLFGSNWDGIVRDDNDWYAAIKRVLAGPQNQLARRHRHVSRMVNNAWADALREKGDHL